MKQILLLLTLITYTFCNGQVIFNENFESPNIPNEWQNNSYASDGGWQFGTSQELSSQSFNIISNGTSIAATNDDECNCNKANEYLITRPIDLSGVSSAILKFDLFYGDQEYDGTEENATVEISLDGVNWVILDDLHGHGGWDEHIINLKDYVGNEAVYLGFKYDDNGGWLYGMAIDNISVEVPNERDASLVKIDSKNFGEIGKEFKISGTFLNNGIEIINSIEIQYSIDDHTPTVQLFENLNLEEFTYSTFEFAEHWIPDVQGFVDVDVEILNINNEADEIIENNKGSFSTEIFDEVIVPNNILQILNSSPVITTIATANNGLDRPTDLDFFPVLGKDELWVINQRTENEGGSTVTISDATADTPSDFDMRVDGNSWHFMSLPTAIAFSDDNFNFANSAGVQDANHNGGTFTGPALWSSDPDIYAQPSGGNGSHLDMLHGSPFCMGIAHEVDNVFWVYDDWNKDIVRYDFAEDHGPGNDDHSDGKLRRYKEIGIQRDGDIPNHMILDKTTGWMYFVDNGNYRVMRLDINSGTAGETLPATNEPLAEHVRMEDFIVEEILEEGLGRPCGIEFFDGFLLVGDYATGAINVYDVNNDFELMGSIETGGEGLAGIKIGPDGKIYAVNRMTNSLISISEGAPTSTIEYASDNKINIYPNPTDSYLNIEIDNKKITSGSSIIIYNNYGQKIFSNINKTSATIDVSNLSAGIYTLEVKASESIYRKQFSIIK